MSICSCKPCFLPLSEIPFSVFAFRQNLAFRLCKRAFDLYISTFSNNQEWLHILSVRCKAGMGGPTSSAGPEAGIPHQAEVSVYQNRMEAWRAWGATCSGEGSHQEGKYVHPSATMEDTKSLFYLGVVSTLCHHLHPPAPHYLPEVPKLLQFCECQLTIPCYWCISIY
jgi:hypothetical protein